VCIKAVVTNTCLILQVADWRLNHAIETQCDAFLKGLRNVIPATWLAPFSAPELQVLPVEP
jgi:hypothetical protein